MYGRLPAECSPETPAEEEMLRALPAWRCVQGIMREGSSEARACDRLDLCVKDVLILGTYILQLNPPPLVLIRPST